MRAEPAAILSALLRPHAGYYREGFSTDGVDSNNAVVPTGYGGTVDFLNAVPIASVEPDVEVTYDDWVHPEDLPPMPQCVAEQDQSSLLNIMSKCTSKRCTKRVGFCWRHQWLTDTHCLGTELSPQLFSQYFDYCSRSVLAKAQLYQWVQKITGRSWLVDVGDTTDVLELSPSSLEKGFANVKITNRAPSCLTDATSASSSERFGHVFTSCRFTDSTRHTGNVERPWEYNEGMNALLSLDTEIAGYDLTGGSISNGDYFDIKCFCSTYGLDLQSTTCSGLDTTREYLWMNAICGPTSLPDNWKDSLMTTDYAYIPVEDWNWPSCVTDMPVAITERPLQCETDACEVDPDGYCETTPSIDRACFCQGISYDSCGGSCHIFETRIEYLEWLNTTCGLLPDWNGLPDDWHQLIIPTSLDMMPWKWTVKSLQNSSSGPSAPDRQDEQCASNAWKLGSFILINMATLLATIVSQKRGRNDMPYDILSTNNSQSWFLRGLLLTGLSLCAMELNAYLVTSTAGYEAVPVIGLMLLWCTMPRLTWITTFMAWKRPLEAMECSIAKAALLMELVLQALASKYMLKTLTYGVEHGFYTNGSGRLPGSTSTQAMYAGALLWVVVATSTIFVLLVSLHLHLRSHSMERASTSGNLEQEPLLSHHEANSDTTYSTIPKDASDLPQEKGLTPQEKNTIMIWSGFASVVMLFLWVAQWLFWAGFIGLALTEYVTTLNHES
ncbi:hypothetical protein EJ05DRAFT_499318 [Pseudovirgaria hyperparasitica]|uniref:Uncharacterized protein n=1 Tax=Pseudovirgaria hyperparasitica TaxID=470096 RepID=A0A6A6W8K8_9PEZI|nr:uncharacterized protein EJ05DRAFT_499318 [Pseudovirgaria hyperparasitica]KAF2758885.1 hypothetical protein EJ05DRAFT_499318 [Pseudovirgaria hyperparasitica]